MALWCVIVLLLAQYIFADDNVDNCDACIRMGSTWCHEETSLGHCVQVTTDDGCPMDHKEKLPSIHFDRNGDLFKPMYAERTLYITGYSRAHTMPVTYTSPTKRNVTLRFVNQTTEQPKIDINIVDKDCVDSECTVELKAKVRMDFCSYYEFVDVMVVVEGFKEEAQIRYYVPCSCPCTKLMERKSKKCSHHGNYTCGICSCEAEWTGEKCQEECYRGDGMTPEDCVGETGLCNGNGKCPCNMCKCFDDIEGSQYLDPNNQCEDICMQTHQCSDCLLNATLGHCHSCRRDLNVIEYNKTILNDKDEAGRKMWVHCKPSEFNFEYYTMRIVTTYFVMMNAIEGPGYIHGEATSSKVPLILGTLILIAAVAALIGVLIWKHMNAIPALPTTDSQYANLDAEDCTGENPLYIPPTSSFKNPTYGKC